MSNLAICARNTDSLSAVEAAVKSAATAAKRAEPRVLCVSLDVTSAESVEAAAKQIGDDFGVVDVLMHNSGILESGKITEIDPKAWWRVWELNVYGPFLVARSFIPLLLKGHLKQFVITSSVGAWLDSPGVSAYQPSKLAVLRFADFINSEYGDRGLVAFCIHPGNVLTDIVGGEDSDFSLKHRELRHRHWVDGAS